MKPPRLLSRADYQHNRDLEFIASFVSGNTSYFTNAPILNHIHGQWLPNGLPRAYVGSLKFNRKLEYRGRLLKASELAARIAPALRKPLAVGERKQWYFTCTLRIPDVRHKVRMLILWQHQEDEQARLIVV